MPAPQLNTLQRALDHAKVDLMMNKKAVFFTTIVFSLKFKWDDTCTTAWTDGYEIGCNPDFFMALPKAHRVFVLVHEACHVAYEHMGRMLGKMLRIWNQACDHVINLMLEEAGFSMPDWVLKDRRFAGMSSEQVYRILLAEEEAMKANGGNSLNGGSSGAPGNPMEDMREREGIPAKVFQKHVQDIIIRASIQAKMEKDGAGIIPGEVELFLQGLLRPKLPWQSILRREVGTYAKTGFSWMKPNRRFFPDFHLPSRWAKAPSELTFYVDISISVEDYQFHQFISEIAGVLRMFMPKKITVVQFDTQIKSVVTVRSLRELSQISFKGRGGTHIECILKHMEQTKPELALVFTDGGFDWPRKSFKQRMIWLINDNSGWLPKFGRAVHFNTQELK